MIRVAHCRILEPLPDGMLSRENRHYLENVLRLRAGDSFTVTDGKGKEAAARILAHGRYEIDSWVDPQREPEIEVALFPGVTKGDSFEWLIEKAVEMGVARIVPVFTERSVIKTVSSSKLDRWKMIALSAMLQCGGCRVPEITVPEGFSEIKPPPDETGAFFLHENSISGALRGLPSACTSKIWLASGPEGGFTDREVEYLQDAGWRAVWLGKRLFKSETAPLVALADILINRE